MTKIEEIARAIYERMPNADDSGRPLSWEECGQIEYALCRDLAHIALKTLREPSDKMLDALRAGCYRNPPSFNGREGIQAMIDAALEEGDG